tara:strand:+ start:213 stop:449 length:237 start_codon:yes stop_codon:yes gene_type:complete
LLAAVAAVSVLLVLVVLVDCLQIVALLVPEQHTQLPLVRVALVVLFPPQREQTVLTRFLILLHLLVVAVVRVLQYKMA